MYFNNKELGPVARLEEGKEKVQEYLKDKIKELQDFILPIEIKQWNDMSRTITQAPKIEDDYNYLKGFYDGAKGETAKWATFDSTKEIQDHG